MDIAYIFYSDILIWSIIISRGDWSYTYIRWPIITVTSWSWITALVFLWIFFLFFFISFTYFLIFCSPILSLFIFTLLYTIIIFVSLLNFFVFIFFISTPCPSIFSWTIMIMLTFTFIPFLIIIITSIFSVLTTILLGSESLNWKLLLNDSHFSCNLINTSINNKSKKPESNNLFHLILEVEL